MSEPTQGIVVDFEEVAKILHGDPEELAGYVGSDTRTRMALRVLTDARAASNAHRAVDNARRWLEYAYDDGRRDGMTIERAAFRRRILKTLCGDE